MDEELAYLVLSVVEEIPAGRVATYGQLARLIGRERNARLVQGCCPTPRSMAAFPATGWWTTADASPPAGRSRPVCWPRRASPSGTPPTWT